MGQMDRYHRQMLLPAISAAGQAKLACAHVLLIGCGALGCGIADQLARAGIGHLRIVDRDIVELTNLQRQCLFDETDARDGTPKASAAANRLRAINSSIAIEPVVADVHSGNIEELAGMDGQRVDLVLDGTDNAETRYLINDMCVKHDIPWVYGACVGTTGRVMVIQPGQSACLRCIFPQPPTAGELPTCDTAGVLGSAAMIVASLQAVEAIRLLTGNGSNQNLLTMDLWTGRFHSVETNERQKDCFSCIQRNFEFLDAPLEQSAIQLCGRTAVQIRPPRPQSINLVELAERLNPIAAMQQHELFLRCQPMNEKGIDLTIFADGRVLVRGTTDITQARTLVSKYVGS